MLVINSINSLQLQTIHDNSFPLPDINEPAYIGKKTIIEGGSVIGCGLVKQTLEGILILDPKAPKLSKARGLETLIDSFIHDMQALGQRECHVFVKNEKFRELLIHLGFKDCQGGTPMIIHF